MLKFVAYNIQYDRKNENKAVFVFFSNKLISLSDKLNTAVQSE